jgi:hypothetical protein
LSFFEWKIGKKVGKDGRFHLRMEDALQTLREATGKRGEIYVGIIIISSGWWLEPWNFMTFHILGRIIIPTDLSIFFRGVGQPPTSYFFWGGFLGKIWETGVSLGKCWVEPWRKGAQHGTTMGCGKMELNQGITLFDGLHIKNSDLSSWEKAWFTSKIHELNPMTTWKFWEADAQWKELEPIYAACRQN